MLNILRTAISALIAGRPSQPRHDWQLMSFGGGGRIVMQHATRKEAMDAASKSGQVAFVDDANRFVFYKPPGFNGQQSAVAFESKLPPK